MIAPELRALRVSAGLKGYELAAKLGMAGATLSRYERGHAVIPKVVEIAAKYICEQQVNPSTPAERLASALREVINGSA